MKQYIDAILNEADKAYKKREVPVGAIIVFNNKIISRAYNKRIGTKDVTAHAEIIAIRKASKKIKDWRLSDCDLYVTLKPCDMCWKVINEARIRNVYYLLEKDEMKKPYNKTNISLIDDNEYSCQIEKYKNVLSDFFKLNCKR